MKLGGRAQLSDINVSVAAGAPARIHLATEGSTDAAVPFPIDTGVMHG